MSDGMHLGALVLAAGMAKRMGTSKQLLPFRDRTLIENTVDSVLRGGAEQVVVVTGCYAEDVERVLRKSYGDTVILARNADYETTDMMHSIRLGLAAMPGCDAFYLIPGDMPAVEEDTFRKIVAVYRKYCSGERPVVVFPTYEGRRNHPPLISSELIPAITGYSGDGGLRQFWRDCGACMMEVPVDDPGVWTDVDTPEDYRQLVERSAEH